MGSLEVSIDNVFASVFCATQWAEETVNMINKMQLRTKKIILKYFIFLYFNKIVWSYSIMKINAMIIIIRMA